MRTLILLISLSMMAWVGSCSPTDRDDNGFKSLDQRLLVRRSSHAQDVKGRKTPSHHNPQATTKSRPELNLRKGEYMCSGRVCKLRPGEIPPGCNGVCQYPVL
ncbi:uncharacterized protein LOC106716438 [Papilio machaon]|uniref:uncharacterized protein LOC106716438 n=1 Tax=Papilio machaon TaxID=76193 RepID=UPI001E662E1E|nr:uncharacterized protein LOC106716438 [Papilio machaon]